MGESFFDSRRHRPALRRKKENRVDVVVDVVDDFVVVVFVVVVFYIVDDFFVFVFVVDERKKNLGMVVDNRVWQRVGVVMRPTGFELRLWRRNRIQDD